jgi:NTP pyrophosphatase (non-canonical NTP hydrolase)
MSKYRSTIYQVEAEAVAAGEQYGDFTSSHEAYGVLAEEVAELLDAIRSNSMDAIAREARQVAAVALRTAHCAERSLAFMKRSAGGDA